MWSMDYDSFRPPKKPFPFSSESYTSENSMNHLNDANHRGQARHGGCHWDDRNHRHNNNRKHFPFHSDSETDSSFTDYTYTSYPPKFESFHPTHIQLSRRAARHIREDEILILPPSLTRLKISLLDPYGHHLARSIHTVVAGDMSLRSVIKQVLSPSYLSDARTHVKLRGEWNEVGAPILLSEITGNGNGRYAVNERGEVEVRVVLGGGGRGGIRVGMGGGGGRGGEVPRFGWERGSVERLRVY